MARFAGEVGYGVAVEDPPESGIWVNRITEVPCFGDVIRNVRNLVEGDKGNDDISVSHSISIVANQYANDNFLKIKYVRWMGVLWSVPSVEVRAPRLILSLGDVYNGPLPEVEEEEA